MARTTCKLMVGVGEHIFRLRVLSDVHQPDEETDLLEDLRAPGGEFGRLWPAARVMAEAMNDFAVSGLRILEIGCGLGLPSLVLKRRGADITASDHHSLAQAFLEYNAALNELGSIDYVDVRSSEPVQDVGHFDLIIACNVLSERDLAEVIQLVLEHAAWNVELVVSDPGDGLAAPFVRKMQKIGFSFATLRPQRYDGDFRFKTRLLRFKRPLEFLGDPMPQWSISPAAALSP